MQRTGLDRRCGVSAQSAGACRSGASNRDSAMLNATRSEARPAPAHPKSIQSIIKRKKPMKLCSLNKVVRAAKASVVLASGRRDGLVGVRAAGDARSPIRTGASPSSCPIPRAAPPMSRPGCSPHKLSEAWKQPVVVENKSGGGGVVGNDFVAKAAARRLHRADRHHPDHPGAEPRCEPALRRLQGSRAGDPGRAVDRSC